MTKRMFFGNYAPEKRFWILSNNGAITLYVRWKTKGYLFGYCDNKFYKFTVDLNQFKGALGI